MHHPTSIIDPKAKIDEGVDLFDRGHNYQKIIIDEDFPKYLFQNLDKYKKFIILLNILLHMQLNQ